MRASDILNQLQLKITADNAKSNLIPFDVKEMFGPGFVSQYAEYSDDSDVPNVADTRTYTTHRTFVLPKGKKGGSNYLPFETESTLYEQDDDEDKKKKGEDIEADADMAADAAEEATEEATGESDEETSPGDEAGAEGIEGGDPGAEAGAEGIEGEPGAEGIEGEPGADAGAEGIEGEPGADAGMGDMGDAGVDAGMGDMGGMPGQEEEQKSSGELGRIYELKKIYSRLTSIESYLSDESSGQLSEIRNHVSQCIELFEIVSSNFDSYKDKLDEIIIMYYKFIMEVYTSVKNFYKKETMGVK